MADIKQTQQKEDGIYIATGALRSSLNMKRIRKRKYRQSSPGKLTYNGLSITYKVIRSHAVKARRLEIWKLSAFVHDLIKPAISWDHESNIENINRRDSNEINNSSPFK